MSRHRSDLAIQYAGSNPVIQYAETGTTRYGGMIYLMYCGRDSGTARKHNAVLVFRLLCLAILEDSAWHAAQLCKVDHCAFFRRKHGPNNLNRIAVSSITNEAKRPKNDLLGNLR